MKYGILWFSVVSHEDGAFSHHLEVGTFSFNFIFTCIPGIFKRDDEELGIYREVVDVFLYVIVDFYSFIFQVQGERAYYLGIDDTPDTIYLVVICIVPFI